MRQYPCVEGFTLHVAGLPRRSYEDMNMARQARASRAKTVEVTADSVVIEQGVAIELPGTVASATQKTVEKWLDGTLEFIDDSFGSVLSERINAIAGSGVPNYFGPQRFGRDGNNVERALDLIRNPSTRINPNLRGLFFSAARSEIFNQILSERVMEGSWNLAIPGDVYMFPDSKSHFEAAADDLDIQDRIQQMRIHPSGPLVGEKPSTAKERALEIETRILARFTELHEGLQRERLESLRRPYRLVPEQLSAQPLENGSLRLQFNLPAGTYATTVLRELLNFESSQHPEV